MSHTPLFDAIRRTLAYLELSKRTGRPIEDIQQSLLLEKEKDVKLGISRREFLYGIGTLTATSLLPKFFSASLKSFQVPRIAIIGSGIAGLSAGLTLKDAGVPFTIYEASTGRVGGRMLSEGKLIGPGCGACHPVSDEQHTVFLEGQVADIFAEGIDRDNPTILSLARRFGLPLINQVAAAPAGTNETFYFFNQYYPYEDAMRDFSPLLDVIKEDLQVTGYPTTYNKSTPEGRALDTMSAYDWIESRVPGGHASQLGAFLEVVIANEYGAETSVQSSLNPIYFLGYIFGLLSTSAQPPSPWPSNYIRMILGMRGSEKYKIRGGVERLPKAIADHLGMDSVIKMGWMLEAIAKNPDGTYTLSFYNSQSVVADMVLLALPFSAFVNFDYSLAGFDDLKCKAIREQGQAHNSKLQLQFNRRYWNELGPWGRSEGTMWSDTDVQNTWDATLGQPGNCGILVGYNGAHATDALYLKHSYGNIFSFNEVTTDAQVFLQEIEKIFPGISPYWNGRAIETISHLNPLVRTSFAYYGKGQYQSFAGYERVRQGAVFFAGEHTSIDYLGLMEGAAAEGIRAGKEILETVGAHSLTNSFRAQSIS